jgi:hypothetical protein
MGVRHARADRAFPLPIVRRGDDSIWNGLRFWSEAAEQAFSKARRHARWEVFKGRLLGQHTCLQAYDDATGGPLITRTDRGYEDIPISSIVGSVDKPCWFTPSFHPRSDHLKERWKRAYATAHGLVGHPPVHLYQLADSYFVEDGHFRISVAKTLGADSMRAHVEEWS